MFPGKSAMKIDGYRGGGEDRCVDGNGAIVPNILEGGDDVLTDD